MVTELVKDADELLTVQQAAKEVGLFPMSLYRSLRRGALPAVNVERDQDVMLLRRRDVLDAPLGEDGDAIRARLAGRDPDAPLPVLTVAAEVGWSKQQVYYLIKRGVLKPLTERRTVLVQYVRRRDLLHFASQPRPEGRPPKKGPGRRPVRRRTAVTA